MHKDFWQARWASNQIDFHLGEVNPQLVRHQGVLSAARQILVPLCGKSLDLAWLAAQGFAVLGVELAEKAVTDFFDEQRLQPDIREQDGFRIYSAGALQLWCGDFFALQARHLADCDGLYDRAALIALPPAMRRRYAEHLSCILPPGCHGLLVSLDYPPGADGGAALCGGGAGSPRPLRRRLGGGTPGARGCARSQLALSGQPAGFS